VACWTRLTVSLEPRRLDCVTLRHQQPCRRLCCCCCCCLSIVTAAARAPAVCIHPQQAVLDRHWVGLDTRPAAVAGGRMRFGVTCSKQQMVQVSLAVLWCVWGGGGVTHTYGYIRLCAPHSSPGCLCSCQCYQPHTAQPELSQHTQHTRWCLAVVARGAVAPYSSPICGMFVQLPVLSKVQPW
jgi:hypothetical protein